MSRVPDVNRAGEATHRSAPTITVDTSYVAFRSPVHSNGDGSDFNADPQGGYFETAARVDRVRYRAIPGPWVILGQYRTREQALAGHAQWRDRVREFGLPTRDMWDNEVDVFGSNVHV